MPTLGEPSPHLLLAARPRRQKSEGGVVAAGRLVLRQQLRPLRFGERLAHPQPEGHVAFQAKGVAAVQKNVAPLPAPPPLRLEGRHHTFEHASYMLPMRWCCVAQSRPVSHSKLGGAGRATLRLFVGSMSLPA